MVFRGPDPRITIHYRSQIKSPDGDDHLRSVTIDQGGKVVDIATQAIFIMVGAAPNSDRLSGRVDLDREAADQQHGSKS